jgi:hypothetical protein
MSEILLGYWRRKPQYSAAGKNSVDMYAEWNRFPCHLNQDEWEFIGAASAPNRYVAQEIRSKGCCLRESLAKNTERRSRWY